MARGRRIDDYLGGGRSTRDEGQASGCDRVLAERAAELAAEKVAATFLSKIVDEIESLRREVELLRAELERMRKYLQQLQASGRSGPERRGRKRVSRLAEILAEKGFLFGSEARSKLGVSPLRLKSEAEEAGAVVIEMEGDIAVMDRRAYEEFLALLASLKTSDPVEAAKSMGRYEKLFTELRRSGRVYYDARRSMWRLL